MNSTAQRKARFFSLKGFIGFTLLLAMAVVFLFSAVSKLFAFHPFVWNVMDAGISDMTAASIVARLFIGLELLLGLFLLFHLFLRSFTYPAVVSLLVVFSVYLGLLIMRQGDGGNCGCFGEAYEMKPSAAIIKNIVMMLVAVVLAYIRPGSYYKQAVWLSATVSIASLTAPFIIFPIAGSNKPITTQEYIDLTPLYHSNNPENKPAAVELRTGKHIVVFLSLTCSHCRKAAFQLQVVKRQHPELPLFFVLNGHPDQLSDFFAETHAERVPHLLFRGAAEFQAMAGSGVPAIYYVNNSVIERTANYFQLDPKYMKQWLAEK